MGTGDMQMKANPHSLLLGITLSLFLCLPALLLAASDEVSQRRSAVFRLYAEYRQHFPEVSDVNPIEAKRLFREGKLQFIDVREPEEIHASTLPDAIDKQTFLRKAGEFRDTTLVAYCTIGYRSGIFAREMAHAGVPVTNLAGGILAWVLEGGKVFDHEGETKRLHVYGPKWNLAPSDFETLEFNLLKRLSL
jgi:sodium/bile acid cotransporter 7